MFPHQNQNQAFQDKNKINYGYIVENYNRICYNIKDAKSKYRNSEERIDLMAVTKTIESEIINIAIDCGITLLGENRVQEYLLKKDSYDKKADVHIIGHLQTNKVKYIINDVSMIQSVGSIKLACEIDRHAKANNRTMDVLLEVNIGGEESKNGISAEFLDELAEQVSELDNVRIKGLMAIPPINSEELLYYKMQQLFNDIKDKNIKNADVSVLSVGMSGDYEMAIKYGSNLVRIGTGLFGARK